MNDIRLAVLNLLRDSLGEWYNIHVFATSDHVADRFLDRSQSIKKDLAIVKEMLVSLANHYPCKLLYFVRDNYENQFVVLHRKINGRTFAVPVTVKKFPPMEEGGKEMIRVTIRTVIPDYVSALPAENILIDYKYPKITFEYDGYRRVLSRLARLVQSVECPPALRVLRTK
jgi:hypothetical protein